MLQPPLDDVVLGTRPHYCHEKHVLRRMPGRLHAVKAAVAQPDHSPVFIQSHVAAVLDDGVFRELPLALPTFVDDDGLMMIEEGQLLGDLIHSPMLLPLQSLLVLEGVWHLFLFTVGDLIALSLLRVHRD